MNTKLHSITIRRTLNADRQRVFSAFSSAESLTKWLSPHPDITVEALEFDFVMGGGYQLRYSMLDGSKPVLSGLFEIIDPPNQLAFTWIWDEPDTHANQLTRVHVGFNEKGTQTEIIITHEQIPSSDMAERHAVGWEATLDALEILLVADEGLPISQKVN